MAIFMTSAFCCRTDAAFPRNINVATHIWSGLKPLICVTYTFFSLSRTCVFHPTSCVPRSGPAPSSKPGPGFKAIPNWNCMLSSRRMEAGYRPALATACSAATPLSKSGKRMEPYSVQGGRRCTFTSADVMMPHSPSLPRAMWWRSGPVLTRGAPSDPFSSTPLGVTIFTDTTMSSMLPYTLFFMPDARVAIHPPSVENSMLSGS
mmetsp:Transcript_32939/g.82773  ORF Transcript_32939/g.82773 Transcript_32939/m.82773 type:complete len:205 (+) Transcript_32939:144-758(+)